MVVQEYQLLQFTAITAQLAEFVFVLVKDKLAIDELIDSGNPLELFNDFAVSSRLYPRGQYQAALWETIRPSCSLTRMIS